MPATESHSVETPAPSSSPQPPSKPRSKTKRGFVLGIGGGIFIVAAVLGTMEVIQLLNTVSTDDAYVNGHVTYVAARVAGQVEKVLVDDNNRVHKGDLLVQLDPEPFQVQVNIAQAAVDEAQSDLVTAQAQTRAAEGAARSLRYSLEHSIEDVDNQIALLHSKVATLASEQAILARAQGDYDRAAPLVSSGAVTQEEYDHRKQALTEAHAAVEEALEGVYQIRVGLGLPPQPANGDLTSVPDDLDQTFSTVRQAQYALMEAAAQLGVFQPINELPKEMVATFYKRDPHGNIENIYAAISKDAPAVKQAEAKLFAAQKNLDQADLNLRYCNVIADIDGVVTRRDVNPGDNIIVGQGLMSLHSLTDIWVDANFKETQLGDLRIGQHVDLDVDMYGGRHRFNGRISGFEFGTGSTLALLPPENATGNFVKVVQRLPVRIDLVDYDPDVLPLFVGLSVEPTVHINEPATGPDAGKFLQPYLTLPSPAAGALP